MFDSSKRNKAMYTADNFFTETAATFTPANIEFRVDYTSKGGSQYMYTAEGVYRRSDHWGAGISTCAWFLEGFEGVVCKPSSGLRKSNQYVVGFCAWDNFFPIHIYKAIKAANDGVAVAQARFQEAQRILDTHRNAIVVAQRQVEKYGKSQDGVTKAMYTAAMSEGRVIACRQALYDARMTAMNVINALV